jgi:hypothetical protein
LQTDQPHAFVGRRADDFERRIFDVLICRQTGINAPLKRKTVLLTNDGIFPTSPFHQSFAFDFGTSLYRAASSVSSR